MSYREGKTADKKEKGRRQVWTEVSEKGITALRCREHQVGLSLGEGKTLCYNRRKEREDKGCCNLYTLVSFKEEPEDT